jgi:hypothetical protein
MIPRDHAEQPTVLRDRDLVDIVLFHNSQHFRYRRLRRHCAQPIDRSHRLSHDAVVPPFLGYRFYLMQGNQSLEPAADPKALDQRPHRLKGEEPTSSGLR